MELTFRIKFNNYIIKCQECKIVSHLECKDFVPVICTLGQNKVNNFNTSEQLPVKNQFQTPRSNNQLSSG